MGKIKMNLDMLEEVRKQNEIAMNATEQVINNGREDLASMTEEVWEGEDGDMARELLDDLLNKKMAQTWREIDAIHESVKKTQKKAYEAKNFCNKFPQIFRDGTMPSDTDSTPCSGDLMCDKSSCEQLKANMEAAAKSASSIKSNVESAESILAELETDEAKFDYSSYTETIKTQAQNVIDRVDIFNKAVTMYEQKVEELDQTFSQELLAAIPEKAPVPFDPSVLLSGDHVHMKDGDIINFLETHGVIDLGGRLSDAQLEIILKTLFDKKDIDVSALSERDLEIAFLNISEEKQRTVLIELGLTRQQINTIMAEIEDLKAGKKGAAGKVAKGLAKIIKQVIEKLKEKIDQSDEDDNNGTQSGSGSSNSGGNVAATPGDPIYQRGDEGEDIKVMQQWLHDNGYYTCAKIDGAYGGKMELAIYRFQQQHGLPATGYIDENTLQLLNELMNSTEPDPYQALVIDMDYISENYDLTEHQYDVLERLYYDTTLGLSREKKNSMLIIAAEMYKKGMEDTFVAGVLANVEGEGTAGEFQGLDYALDGDEDPDGICYANEYSGGNIQVIGLQKTLILSYEVKEVGEYGIGSAQWTETSRRKALERAYIDALGYPSDENDDNPYDDNPTWEQDHPTEEQCIRIEAAFEADELLTYKVNIKGKSTDVYDYWSESKFSNAQEAAREAAKDVCLYYEVPEDKETKAEERGERAISFYNVFMGE